MNYKGLPITFVDDDYALQWASSHGAVKYLMNLINPTKPAIVDVTKYPHLCNRCGAPSYNGFSSVDCSKCGNH
jgi:hypothetical protein